MDIIEAIFTRRSIRQYRDDPIADATIENLLRAGMQAPSAHNTQPWHFIVITDRAILTKIPEFHPYSKMLTQANCAILVCGESADPMETGYIIQDCSAATENILLAAHAEGLGAVWLGIYPQYKRIKEIRRLFDIPAGILPVSLSALGYPSEQLPRTDRYQANRVYRNRWGRTPKNET